MNNPASVSLSQVERALQDLGGEATWPEILKQVTNIRSGNYSHYRNRDNYEKTAFQIIQQHCRGYRKYKGPARIEKVGRHRFRLLEIVSSPRGKIQPTPIAKDIEEPSGPNRVKQETYRILRDTALARQVKETNRYVCQLCRKCRTFLEVWDDEKINSCFGNHSPVYHRAGRSNNRSPRLLYCCMGVGR